jgi:hypothetical protein
MGTQLWLGVRRSDVLVHSGVITQNVNALCTSKAIRKEFE